MNMESRLRYRFFGPEQALEGAGVRSAQTVLDIGCGTGFWNGTISWTPSKLCKAVDFTLANGSAFAMRGYRHRK